MSREDGIYKTSRSSKGGQDNTYDVVEQELEQEQGKAQEQEQEQEDKLLSTKVLSVSREDGIYKLSYSNKWNQDNTSGLVEQDTFTEDPILAFGPLNMDSTHLLLLGH